MFYNKKMRNWFFNILAFIFLLVFVNLEIYFVAFSHLSCANDCFRNIRLVKEKSMYLDGENLTQKWDDFIKKGIPANKYFPLIYSNGQIEWRKEDLSGKSTEFANREKGIFKLELNTIRAARPYSKSTKGNSKTKDKCLFCKLGMSSDVWNELLEYKGYKILVNVFPIEKEGHFTIIPKIQDAKNHVPQFLETQARIEFALKFIKDSENLDLIFNSDGAGASQKHLHFQAFKQYVYPVESAGLKFKRNESGVRISILDNDSFPAEGIVFESDDMANMAKVVFKYVSELNKNDIAYNILFKSGKVYLFPRAREKVDGKELGTLEVAGRFVFVGSELFNNYDEEKCSGIVGKATKMPNCIQVLLDK